MKLGLQGEREAASSGSRPVGDGGVSGTWPEGEDDNSKGSARSEGRGPMDKMNDTEGKTDGSGEVEKLDPGNGQLVVQGSRFSPLVNWSTAIRTLIPERLRGRPQKVSPLSSSGNPRRKLSSWLGLVQEGQRSPAVLMWQTEIIQQLKECV